jgi:hypothetical protein
MHTPHGKTGGSATERAASPQSSEPALGKLARITTANAASDGLLFAGQRHEVVPRALFLDRRLTPLERTTWQVCRLMLNDDGISAFPTYDRLRPFLSSVPYSCRASDETIARALTMLRLTRWLTLVRHRRDDQTGRIQGNLYVLHDEPLTPWEAIQLDPHYLSLVSQSLTHASKAIQTVAFHTLKEITADPLLAGRVLPSRVYMLAQRLAEQGCDGVLDANAVDEIPLDEAAQANPDGSDGALKDKALAPHPPPSSDSEERSRGDHLRNPKTAPTYVRTSSSIYKDQNVRTCVSDHNRLNLPEAFHRLRTEQQAAALAALQQLELALQQSVVEEWASRCRAGTIRNPTGYLFGLIQRALRGEFHLTASGQTQTPTTQTAVNGQSLRDEGQNVQRTEAVRQHIRTLGSLLKIPETR